MIVFLGNAGKLPDNTSPVLAAFYAIMMAIIFLFAWPFIWTIVWFFLWLTPLASPYPESWWAGFWIFTAISIVFMFILFKTTKD